MTVNGRPPDLLVTGTDTGVGKTVIAAAIVLAMRERGVRVVGFKPVESGLADQAPSDAAILAAASGTSDASIEPLLQLGEPLAPAVAADRAGGALDSSALERRVRDLRRAGVHAAFSFYTDRCGVKRED